MTVPADTFTDADHQAAADLLAYYEGDALRIHLAMVVALVAVVRRLDAFAAALAGIGDEMRSATTGGLLGLLTGKR